MSDRRSSADLGPNLEAALSGFPFPERDWEKDALAVDVHLLPDPNVPAGEVGGVTLAGGDFHVSLNGHGETLTIEVNGMSQCNAMPAATDYRLIREELGIEGRDTVFEAALSTASVLALSS